MVTFFDIIIGILVFYSCVPERLAEPFWYRVSDVPVCYIPFFIIFLMIFIKELFQCYLKNRIYFNTSLKIFLIFLLYIPIQLLLLMERGKEIIFDSIIIDYLMLVFYGIVVFYGTFLYFYNDTNNIKTLNKVIERFIVGLVAICLISDVRYLLFDINHAEFYSLFYPLMYRLFEVFFLIVFSTVTLGYYFAKREKRYLVYFTIFSLSIVLSGSRTGYIAYLLILAYLIFREKWQILFSFKAIFVVLVVVVGIVIGGKNIGTRIEMLQNLNLFVKLNYSEAIDKHEDITRIALLIGSWDIIKKYPFIGVGLGKDTLREYFPQRLIPILKKGIVYRPHNFYVYITVAFGLIGAGIMLLFLFQMVYYGYTTTKLRGLSTPLREMTLHLVLANILILIIKMGYELETEPFLWMFWGMSISYFYHTRQANKLEILQAQPVLTEPDG